MTHHIVDVTCQPGLLGAHLRDLLRAGGLDLGSLSLCSDAAELVAHPEQQTQHPRAGKEQKRHQECSRQAHPGDCGREDRRFETAQGRCATGSDVQQGDRRSQRDGQAASPQRDQTPIARSAIRHDDDAHLDEGDVEASGDLKDRREPHQSKGHAGREAVGTRCHSNQNGDRDRAENDRRLWESGAARLPYPEGTDRYPERQVGPGQARSSDDGPPTWP